MPSIDKLTLNDVLGQLFNSLSVNSLILPGIKALVGMLTNWTLLFFTNNCIISTKSSLKNGSPPDIVKYWKLSKFLDIFLISSKLNSFFLLLSSIFFQIKHFLHLELHFAVTKKIT